MGRWVNRLGSWDRRFIFMKVPRVDESRTLIVSPIPRWFLYEVGGYDHRPPARFYTLWFFIMYSCMYVCIVSINMNKHVEYVYIHADIYIYMYVCSIYLYVSLPMNLSICQPVHQYIYVLFSIYPSTYLPIYLSIYLIYYSTNLLSY